MFQLFSSSFQLVTQCFYSFKYKCLNVEQSLTFIIKKHFIFKSLHTILKVVQIHTKSATYHCVKNPFFDAAKQPKTT